MSAEEYWPFSRFTCHSLWKWAVGWLFSAFHTFLRFAHFSSTQVFLRHYVAFPGCGNPPIVIHRNHRGVVKFTDLIAAEWALAQQLQIIDWFLIRSLRKKRRGKLYTKVKAKKLKYICHMHIVAFCAIKFLNWETQRHNGKLKIIGKNHKYRQKHAKEESKI